MFSVLRIRDFAGDGIMLNRKTLLVCSVMFFLLVNSFASRAQVDNHPRSIPNLSGFDKDWRFAKFGPQADGSFKREPMRLEQTDFNDSGWRKLDLPHDWAIEGPFIKDRPNNTGKRAYPGIGWYRKHFKLAEKDKGKRIFIDFDGAMSHTKVWLNGDYIGEWPYGYASFRFELTEHIKFGEDNCIAVRLDNPDDSSRWYPGGGIYRHTRLVKTNPVHIAHWGTFVTTPDVKKDSATVAVDIEIENQSSEDAVVTVKNQISPLDKPEDLVAQWETTKVQIRANLETKISTSCVLDKPKLWNIDSPNLYRLRSSIIQDGKVIDTYETIFGIRMIEFDADKGFLLNGKRVPLNGVCLHHDLGPLGTAIYRRGIERQLEILREMGCNAIRTSHNPPAPELLELCDRMGFVVIDEAFDCWAGRKTSNDYGRLFRDWYVRDVRAMVKRDRNHPCVIMYSSGNEISEQRQGERGLAISRNLTSLFHRLDKTRPVTAGCNDPNSVDNGFAGTIDVYGFNYKPHLYGDFHDKFPDKMVYSSESSSCVSSRGEYFFPVNEKKNQGFFNFQVSSYDLYAPRWAMRPDIEFEGLDKYPFTAGEFVWTGFDYLGEPTPYNRDETLGLNFQTEEERKAFEEELKKMQGKAPSRSSYFGIMDLCGFRKDRFYIYQARWRPELPMAHILPHWNWPQRVGEITPVHVYTSGDEAELFLNGKSLGRKTKGQYEYRLRWDDVRYVPGELKVVAYKDGKQWATAARKTTGPAARLQLKPDRETITADGRDLCYVTVELTDAEGLIVPDADNYINFSMSGPGPASPDLSGFAAAGEIIATANGDATNQDSFQAKSRNAYNGLCLVIIRSVEGQAGEITLNAESEGLAPAKVTIKSK
ncbi:MAG: DUF4982 domain-containing protein [Sedimentisphaerales bacterium]|nr:DUF4982 domain-containing protein [Sedimentisphaerales bacterium]